MSMSRQMWDGPTEADFDAIDSLRRKAAGVQQFLGARGGETVLYRFPGESAVANEEDAADEIPTLSPPRGRAFAAIGVALAAAFLAAGIGAWAVGRTRIAQVRAPAPTEAATSVARRKLALALSEFAQKEGAAALAAPPQPTSR